jgi:hypothetical protein
MLLTIFWNHSLDVVRRQTQYTDSLKMALDRQIDSTWVRGLSTPDAPRPYLTRPLKMALPNAETLWAEISVIWYIQL